MTALHTIDWAVIIAYLAGIVGIGTWAGRRASQRSLSDFFLGGRRLPWWLLGTSLVATTLAADTPLAVAGLTIKNGIAGNWFWWSAAVSHVLVTVALARLWRRSQVVTDAEFCELRYPGRGAGTLRTLKAFYYAVPINCIVMGWVFLAMAKVGQAVFPGIASWQIVGFLLLLTLLYSVRSGLMGVVFTDLIQFPIALAGTIALAWVVVTKAGGLEAIRDAAVARSGPEAIDLFPVGGTLLPWQTLTAFLAVQWWAQKSSDGGGLFVQRLLAARSERDAELGGLWFCIAHYVLRPWPWILTGMAAIVLLDPAVVAEDPEGTYPRMILEFLPVGLRGVLVAAFLAAFMSTIDTHLNWGASYVANDMVNRWMTLKPEQLPLVSRLSVLAIALIAVAISLFMDTVAGAWEFLLAFGAGSGAVVLLRWYWWRITALTEISAMLASSLLAIVAYTVFDHWSYPQKLGLVVTGSAAIWFPTALLTARSPQSLATFYKRVRPPGPGWRTVTEHLALPAPPSLRPHLLRWVIGLTGILSMLLGTGKALLGHPLVGLSAVFVGLCCLIALARKAATGHRLEPDPAQGLE